LDLYSRTIKNGFEKMKYKMHYKKSPETIQTEGSTGKYINGFDFDKCIKDNFGEYGKASLTQLHKVLPERIFIEFCRRQNIDCSLMIGRDMVNGQPL